MQKILSISAKKQGGKSSASNFIHGWELRHRGSINYFDIDDDTGELIVNTVSLNDQGEEVAGYGPLDIGRTDWDFFQWASDKVWPYVKAYNFADKLKTALVQIFGVSRECLYGTDEEKRQKVAVKWSDLAFALPKDVVKKLKTENKLDEFLTGRELLQQFGTNICRRIQSNCWINACLRQIVLDGVPLAIIADCRFPGEVEAVQAAGGKVIRLTRNPHPDDTHESETALDGYAGFDAVIDNESMSVKEKNLALFEVLSSWGWLEGQIKN